MNISSKEVIKELRKYSRPEKISILSSFFKTGKGDYGEGDKFWGIYVPDTRIVAKKYKDLSFKDIEYLLYHKVHEIRLCGFLILVYKFNAINKDKNLDKLAKEKSRKAIYDFYLKHARQANNWDIVDVTCRDVIGGYLLDKKDRSVLDVLAKSKNLWEKRTSIVTTWMFIKHHQYEDTKRIAKILLNDKHDLIHKAVGWMLREMGKRDESELRAFLNKYSKDMPRVMYRYAVERLRF